MNLIIPIRVRYPLILIISLLFVSGCSSSSNLNSGVSQMAGTNEDAFISNGSIDGVADEMEVATTDNTTRVDFDITVPVYSSNALQVRLVWGDTDTTAIWNSDELWTAATDFPANTTNQLVVTFSDSNGAITLGSIERSFTTGANQSESLQITAIDFDTDRWDSDGDGVSNLNESIAGTPAQVVPENFQTILDVMPTKTFRISWEQSTGATYYQVLENQSGTSGFVPVSVQLPADVLFYNHRVALFKSLNARYVVEACNASGCTSSNELFVAGTLVSGVGAINASDPEESVGQEVTISADGQTLAFMVSRAEPTEEENTPAFSSSVYIYTLEAGAWQQQASVESNNADIGDYFGTAISLSRNGTVLAVGAQSEDSAASGIDGDGTDNSLFGSGAAYIFVLSDGSWQQEAYIKPSEPARLVSFGREIDLSADGETLVVTAPSDTSGAVYIFVRTDSGWQQQAKISSDRGSLSSGFVSLSENGDTLATGGIPHVFSRRDGLWQRTAILEREDIGALRGFGSGGTLSDDGMTLVISADNDGSRATGINPSSEDRFVNATLDRAGGVHVFVLVDGSWVQQAYIKPSVAENYTHFGDAVGISSDGNTLALASRDNTVGTGIFNDYTTRDTSISNGSPDRTGSVYLYQRSVGTWRLEAYIKPAQDNFRFWGGPVIDGSGDTLVVQGSYNNGVVYIY